ncbi:hypothetical protein LNTAR_22904 [Lentisphaera araneosa HTCC2155]|uniref:Uncharacterized protein n=1 Tax=Lentisphaera araneosa HTCC2155 TaxID=313628 RepID=A6DGH2_9BACT|nr:hypothetical protein [Lentisphaera araneosa]EDM29289.1 hypothetical protein LNTAR_22904 [Lentisphaera araneosa HTCC2155]
MTDAQKTAGGIYGPKSSDFTQGEEYAPHYRCPLDNRSPMENRVLRSYSHTQAWYGSTFDAVYDLGGGITGYDYAKSVPFSRSISNINQASQTIAYTGLADQDQTASNDNNHLRSGLGISWPWTGIRADHQDNAGVSHHGDNKYNYAMVDGSIQKFTLLQSLVKTNGTIATTSNVLGSKWDATK